MAKLPAMMSTQRASVRATVGLGVPSLILGIVPLVAPDRAAIAIGLAPDAATCRWLRAIGVRETVVAAGFLADRRHRWIWAFLAQDLMDLPICWTLAVREGPRNRRLLTALAGYAVLMAVDVVTAVRW